MGLKSRRLIVFIIFGGLLAVWFVLTLLAQREGELKVQEIGFENSGQNALIVYNPDLFYNLDEQICIAFAEGLAEEGWAIKIATVSGAKELKKDFDLYVFCANTYNWAPDWPTTNFIKNCGKLEKKPVVAITLGSGSTKRSERLLQETIKSKKGRLLFSKAFWLMRPNDEKSEESNTNAAIEMARALGKQAAVLK